MEYSESTRQALVDSAVELFTERGYGGTSLDEIARSARVTKGALYHHFGGKQAVFEAAFDQVQADIVGRIAAVIAEPSDPWTMMRAGLNAFLEVCLEPTYQRIVVREGAAVMGWEVWRDREERTTFGVLRTVVGQLIAEGEIEPLPLDSLSRVIFGGMSAGATAIAASSDPRRTSAEVGRCMERLLEGLRVS
ncbi:TetR/AcrR family transcriptional regulator [Saccharopolyspora taberi]|uniref:TetR/AcrR family transcriptional regulator n=1 Tax=Saccharopolyspora taberi TaxID=60895 RepID=A0ABN3VF85_9PSEU